MLMQDRENVREFEVYEFTVQQMMPSDGFLVVYANADGSVFTSPVVAWGLVDERCQSRICWKANGEHYAENDGNAVVNRKVVPLVLRHEDGELKPPTDASNFIGVCRVGDDPGYIFEEEIAIYLEENLR